MIARRFVSHAFRLMKDRRAVGRTGYTGPIIVHTQEHAILKKGNPIPLRFVLSQISGDKKDV